jgi:hypothetical protein
MLSFSSHMGVFPRTLGILEMDFWGPPYWMSFDRITVLVISLRTALVVISPQNPQLVVVTHAASEVSFMTLTLSAQT